MCKSFMEFNNYQPYNPYDMNNIENSNMNEANFFNPTVQYEQAYMYYRYLSQQMEYKIKCKEYENLYRKDEQRK